MRGDMDHLELDPLGPMGMGPIADDDVPGPLALAPLSPLDAAGRPTEAACGRSLFRSLPLARWTFLTFESSGVWRPPAGVHSLESQVDLLLAEREGFEPSGPVSQANSLAVSPIRPLSHLSSLPDRSIRRLVLEQKSW